MTIFDMTIEGIIGEIFICFVPLIFGLIYVFKISKYDHTFCYKTFLTPETKPCPDFVPPPTKKKIVHQEDLECLKCKNCGALLNKDLKCEYCGTQWFDKNDKDKIDKLN